MRDFFSFDPKLLLYGFSIVFFASYGQTFFISIFNAEIRNFYKLTDGQFGLIYALGTLTSSLILIGFAKLIDHVDLRLYSFIIAIGLILSCIGLYLLYNSMIFLFFVLFGLRFFGQGAMSHAGETTMARYFGKNRGKAISVSTFGGMIGVMILPIIVVKLIYIIGWKEVWLVSGLSILIFFIPIIFFTLKNQKTRHLNFQESLNNSVNIKKLRTRDIVLNKNFFIFLPISVATPFISTGLTFHQIFIIGQKYWTLQMLSQGFIFLGLFSIIGAILGGPIIDKYDTKKVITFTLFPLFLAILILITFENNISMYFYMSLLGFNLGLGIPFIGSLWAELFDLESLGTVKALLHACSVFFSALSPLIFGYMIDFGLGINSLCALSLFIIIFSTLLTVIYIKIE